MPGCGRLAAAALVASALLTAAILLAPTPRGVTGAGKGGLLVVVTFNNLAYDVKPLLCSGDRLAALVPPGVDPHSYQLTPRDVELLRQASLIVSTGHAPFEVKLRSLVKADKLVEIPRIPGVRLLLNPVTHEPNYHMPIYDPHNYIVFIRYLASRLSALRPSCAPHYREAASRVTARVEALLSQAPRLSRDAVASAPPAQYAVAWLGLNVTWLLKPEEAAAPTTQAVEKARSLLGSGAVAVILDYNGSPLGPADRLLLTLAREAGAPVIRVPAPFAPGSIPEKLEAIVAQARRITR